MERYKFYLVIPISIIVIAFVIGGIPFLKLFVGLPEYELSVDARINTKNPIIIGEVLIQNTGSQSLTNVKVDFGGGDVVNLGTLKDKHKVILTPPSDNKMESVTVSADNNIFVNASYTEVRFFN
ncbi:hypothetical protein JYT57_00665 [Nitrosarchaeum koreense]|nr:hypothetical protein [Nitrosarchaeum koreense]